MSRRIAILVLTLIFLAGPAFAAGERYAFVVGVSNYENVYDLPNAVNDSSAVSRKLRALGFRVTHVRDASYFDLKDQLSLFKGRIKSAETVLFYFSGHGFQLNGANYLVPSDARLSDRQAIEKETLLLSDVIGSLQDRSRSTLIFLDACRNNPLPEGLRQTSGNGLAQVAKGENTFIAFATEPGAVTYDGNGTNSPFTQALVKHMGAPNKSIFDLMINVRNDVEKQTIFRQIPWDQSSLRSQFYFNRSEDDGLRIAKRPKSKKSKISMLVLGADLEDEDEDGEDEDDLPGGGLVFGAPSDGDDADDDGSAENGKAYDIAKLKELRARPAKRLQLASLSADKGQTLLVQNGKGAITRSISAGNRLKISDVKRLIGREVPRTAETSGDRSAPSNKLASIDPKPELQPRFNPAAPLDAATPEAIDEEPVDPVQLRRDIQTELARLNCYTSRVDGQWGKGSRNAVRRFYEAEKATFGSNDLNPSMDLLNRLHAVSGEVCKDPVVVKKKKPTKKKAKKPKRTVKKKKPVTKKKTVVKKKAPAKKPAKKKTAAKASSKKKISKKKLSTGVFR